MKMAICSRSPIQNFDNQRYWIRKANALLNLKKEQDYIDKIYLYSKDLSELKYEFLIKNRKDVGIKHFDDSNVFIECSNTMDDVYENIAYQNLNRERKILIVFDDMIADTVTNKKLQAVVKELFFRCKKTKYFSCVYHPVLCFCSKKWQIKFNILFDYEN